VQKLKAKLVKRLTPTDLDNENLIGVINDINEVFGVEKE
jgi:hypothetical protein